MHSRRPCEAGYFCPLGSATARAKQCGSIGSVCPQGSEEPQKVPALRYSTPADGDEKTRSGSSPRLRPKQGEHEKRKSPTAAAALRGMWPFAQSCSPPIIPVSRPSFCGYVLCPSAQVARAWLVGRAHWRCAPRLVTAGHSACPERHFCGGGAKTLGPRGSFTRKGGRHQPLLQLTHLTGATLFPVSRP